MNGSEKNVRNIPAGNLAGMFSYLAILKLVWPLALGMVNNAVMQFADRLYLARYSLGALEAVLPAGMLMWIFAGFFQCTIGYAGVFVGQYCGAGDAAGARASYRAANYLALGASVLLLPLVLIGNVILSAASSNAELVAYERIYFDIMLLGSVFIFGQTAVSAYFTGLGRTRILFWVNLAGNIINIALDPILIFSFDMGIAGAAYASVASMAIQWVVLFAVAGRKGNNHQPTSADTRTLIGKILKIGSPYGLYGVLNALSFTIFVFVTEGVGALELAVSNACFTVNYLLFAPMEGFASGCSTLVAQAIGANRLDLAWKGTRRCVILGAAFVAVTSISVVVFARPILTLFAAEAGGGSEEFAALGRTLFILMAAWQLFDASEIIVSGALKGAGDTKFVLGWMLFNAFFLWLPLVFAVRHYHNTMPALWCTMISYVFIMCIGSFMRWYRGSWRELRIVQ